MCRAMRCAYPKFYIDIHVELSIRARTYRRARPSLSVNYYIFSRISLYVYYIGTATWRQRSAAFHRTNECWVVWRLPSVRFIMFSLLFYLIVRRKRTHFPSLSPSIHRFLRIWYIRFLFFVTVFVVGFVNARFFFYFMWEFSDCWCRCWVIVKSGSTKYYTKNPRIVCATAPSRWESLGIQTVI